MKEEHYYPIGENHTLDKDCECGVRVYKDVWFWHNKLEKLDD